MTEDNSPTFPTAPPIASQKAADIHATDVGEKPQVSYSFPILKPGEDWNDFQILVRASVLRRTRARLTEHAKQRWPIPEILLGVATLAIGASLSAIVAEVTIGTNKGFWFFIAAPVVAVGTATAYGFLKHYNAKDNKQMAKETLDELPDPALAMEVDTK